MIAIAAFFGLWNKIDINKISILIVSGVIGIVMGDTALYAAYSRLGPRRTSLMFSLSAPFSVFMGIVFLNDEISKFDFLGLGLILIGIVIAVAFRDGNNLKSGWEEVRGKLIIGVGFGILAALGQAAGTIISKPVMEAGVHPVTATALRVGCAAVLLILMGWLPVQDFKAKRRISKKIFLLTTVSTCVGMGLGMTLQMTALIEGRAGVVATFSAMTPIAVLPMLWIITKKLPSLLCWAGAIFACAGILILFNF